MNPNIVEHMRFPHLVRKAINIDVLNAIPFIKTPKNK